MPTPFVLLAVCFMVSWILFIAGSIEAGFKMVMAMLLVALAFCEAEAQANGPGTGWYELVIGCIAAMFGYLLIAAWRALR